VDLDREVLYKSDIFQNQTNKLNCSSQNVKSIGSQNSINWEEGSSVRVCYTGDLLSYEVHQENDWSALNSQQKSSQNLSCTADETSNTSSKKENTTSSSRNNLKRKRSESDHFEELDDSVPEIKAGRCKDKFPEIVILVKRELDVNQNVKELSYNSDDVICLNDQVSFDDDGKQKISTTTERTNSHEGRPGGVRKVPNDMPLYVDGELNEIRQDEEFEENFYENDIYPRDSQSKAKKDTGTDSEQQTETQKTEQIEENDRSTNSPRKNQKDRKE